MAKIYQLRVWNGTAWDTIQISASVEANVEKALGYANEVNNGIFNLITPESSPVLEFADSRVYGKDNPIYDAIYKILTQNENIWGKPAAMALSAAFENGIYWDKALLLFFGWNRNGTTFTSKVQVIPLHNSEDAYCFAYADFTINESTLILNNVNIRLAPLLDSNSIIPSKFLPSYVDDVQDLFTITDVADKSQWSPAINSNALIAYPSKNGTHLYKYQGTGWVDIGAPEKDKIYVCLHKTLPVQDDETQDDEEATIYRWSGSALVQIIDLTSIVGDIAAIKDKYLKKSTETNAVYATNGNGGQTMIPHTSVAVQSTIVSRDNSGAAYVVTPQDVGSGASEPEQAQDGLAVVNKSYLKNIIDGIEIEVTEVK